ncbi:MAG TPA: protease B [Cytophagales bacterium]|nr:protease B [Cytophagales bacterium]HAA21447.1 protease B [Cytophagales bacterium]HAP58782.1 protease B [Cytophagales bacterium]
MKLTKLFLAGLAGVFAFSSCQNDDLQEPYQTDIPSDIYHQLNELGFRANEVVAIGDDTYIVERDIKLTRTEIEDMAGWGQVAGEHYHTTNLVATPRVITVWVDNSLTRKYRQAAVIGLTRYNALNLDISFARASNAGSADILLKASPAFYEFLGILGSAGFPDAQGNPFNEVLLTRGFYDNVQNINGLATTIAHEVGHCVGFRHTDYMDRSYSCGGPTDNEGDGGVGAVYIPGTPAGPSANSWMLACGSPEGDRPFTNADVNALTTLY